MKSISKIKAYCYKTMGFFMGEIMSEQSKKSTPLSLSIIKKFELKPTGEQVGSNDPSLPTHTLPTRQRQGMGAVDSKHQNDGQWVGFDTTEPTHSKPTLTRQEMGASDANNV